MKLHIQENISLKDLNWWRVGGCAEYFFAPHNIEETQLAITWAKKNHQAITVLSSGTNVLISDQGVKGLVLYLKHLNQIKTITTENQLRITALAGTPKHKLLNIFAKYQLAPALFLCGLPGDVGGGIVMNAGVGDESLIPREFSEIVDWIEVLDNSTGQAKQFQKNDLQWKYRSCTGWNHGVIVRAEIVWPLQPIQDFGQKLKATHKKRIKTQPLNQPSCGSVFKNPTNEKSGRLIDQAGLKGFIIGGAKISTKHANFILNTGQATATDIHRLICYIQNKIQNNTGILLETECRYLGEWKTI